MSASMLAPALVAVSALLGVTEVGPDLVERFEAPAAGPGAFVALSKGAIATASHNRLLLHSTWDGQPFLDVHLPCEARGLVVDDYRWAVACDDRVVLGEHSQFQELSFAADGRSVVAFDMQLFFRNWAVALDDGTLVGGDDRGGRWLVPADGRKILRVRMDGISDVVTSYDDGTIAQHDRGRRELLSSVEMPALVELFRGSDGRVRGRVSRDAIAETKLALVHGRVLERATLPPAFRADALLSATEPVAQLAFAAGALCAVRDIRVVCLGPGTAAATAAAVAMDDADDVSAARFPPPEGSLFAPPEKPAPPPTLANTQNVVNLASAGVGALGLVASPFLLSALSPGVSTAGAVTLPFLAAAAGLGGTAVVVGVTVTAVGLVLLSMPRERAHGTDLLSAIVADIANAVSDCAFAIAAAFVTVAAVVAVAAIGVVWLSAASMPAVDTALGGTPPASDPFWPTVVGAASGGSAGLLVWSGVTSTTWALREAEEGEEQAALSATVDAVHAAAWVLGAGAVGGTIGYGVARGP